MKVFAKLTAITASVVLLGSTFQVVCYADNLHNWGFTDMQRFQKMQILDDKGSLQYGVLNAFYGDADEKTPYFLCTYSDDGKLYSTYLVVPRQNVLRYVLRDDIDTAAAAQQAEQIVQQYFPGQGSLQQSITVFDVFAENNHTNTTETSESLMQDLAEAGLISAFYSWGETANYLLIEHGYLTAYSPTEWEWAKKEFDWEAIEAWVKTQHPECQFVQVTDKESNLAKKIGIGETHLTQGDVFYAVIPPDGTDFSSHFTLAMELYEEFGLRGNVYPSPDEAAKNALIGKNALLSAGDVNIDCKISVADAVMLARVVAEDKSVKITDTGIRNADTDHDGLITIQDIVALLDSL